MPNYQDYKIDYTNKKKKKCPLVLKILGIIFSALFVVCCGFTIYTNIICNSLSYFHVEGQSMAETLNQNGIDEDCVYVKKTKDIDYGDIIIYSREIDALGSKKMVIKRLIAKENDSIGFCESGEFSENGDIIFQMIIKYSGQDSWVVYDEPYISDNGTYLNLYNEFRVYNSTRENEILSGECTMENGEKKWVTYTIIPQNSIFYLGDNRYNSQSNDCADYGTMPIDDVVGKVEYIIYGGKNNIFQVMFQMIGIKKWL